MVSGGAAIQSSADTRARLLIVEDDESMQDFYRQFFRLAQQRDFDCVIVGSAESALSRLHDPSHRFDALLLDWTLPGLSGLELLRRLRKDPGTRSLPIFMISSREEVRSCSGALESGADDYLKKPFDPDEFEARLRNVLRHSDCERNPGRVYRLDDLELDERAGQARLCGRPLPLAPKEYALLAIFIRRPDMVHPRSFLWDEVWGREDIGDASCLWVAISTLRKKLGGKWGPRLKASPRRGYMLETRSGAPGP